MVGCCREVYTVWCARVGPASRLLPADQVHSLLHDMQLYPSQAQGRNYVSYSPPPPTHLTFNRLRFLKRALAHNVVEVV